MFHNYFCFLHYFLYFNSYLYRCVLGKHNRYNQELLTITIDIGPLSPYVQRINIAPQRVGYPFCEQATQSHAMK
jgi:hypothetical protein